MKATRVELAAIPLAFMPGTPSDHERAPQKVDVTRPVHERDHARTAQRS